MNNWKYFKNMLTQKNSQSADVMETKKQKFLELYFKHWNINMNTENIRNKKCYILLTNRYMHESRKWIKLSCSEHTKQVYINSDFRFRIFAIVIFSRSLNTPIYSKHMLQYMHIWLREVISVVVFSHVLLWNVNLSYSK